MLKNPIDLTKEKKPFTPINFLIKISILLLLISLHQNVQGQNSQDLFFSEYIEGSSFNKALEIYNGTGATVDLTGYTVELYRNGNSSPTGQLIISEHMASLDAGEVLVIAHSSANETISLVADIPNGAVTNFNGDDAIALLKNGEVIDVIGIIGEDPGSQWGSGATTTKDNTLRRMATVCEGVADGFDDPSDISNQWEGFPQDTFDDLGTHLSDCHIDEPLAVRDFTIQEITSDKMRITWTRPRGTFDEDWKGVVIYASETQPNDAAVTGLNGGDIDSEAQFGQGDPNNNSFAVSKKLTDNDGDIIVTGLIHGETYYFIAYTYRVVENGPDEWSEASPEINATANVQEISNAQATPLDTRVRLNWVNYFGSEGTWWDEVMIIASENMVTTVPEGDAFIANPDFGASETSPGAGEYVVYKGNEETAIVTNLQNGTKYHFKIFVGYKNNDDRVWSSGVPLESTPQDGVQYWTGNAGTTNFSDAMNWEPARVPDASSDIILDHKNVAQGYTITFPSEDNLIEINSITIDPEDGQAITVTLPETNTEGLQINGVGDAVTLAGKGKLINQSKLFIPNGNINILNEGHYVHQNGGSHTGILNNKKVSERGIIEFKVPGTAAYTLSLSGKIFGTLVLSNPGSTSRSYSGGGKSDLNILGDFIINENVAFSPILEANLNFSGNITVNGTWNTKEEQTIIINGNDDQNFESNAITPPQITNLKVDKPSGNLLLNTDLDIIDSLNFVKGHIITGNDHKISLINDATLAGESADGRVLGAIEMTKGVGIGEADFGNLGVAIASGPDDIGQVIVLRNTGPDAAIEAGEFSGIERSWLITADQQPQSGRAITFSWLPEESAGKDLTQMVTYRKENEEDGWQMIGEDQDASQNLSITVNTTAFSEWTVSDLANPLPVKLLYFAAKEENSNAVLIWATASEQDNDGFEIEKSIDGEKFAAIGFVKGAGTSTDLQEYSFTDKKFLTGSYYRLKQVDFDGKSEYSPIIFLEHFSGFDRFIIYPNPIDDQVFVSVPAFINSNQGIRIKLFSLTGIKVFDQIVKADQIQYLLNNNIEQLREGLYFLTLSGNNTNDLFKLIKR